MPSKSEPKCGQSMHPASLVELFSPTPTKSTRLIEEMNRMRRIWQEFSPHGPVNKSGLGLLSMLCGLERSGYAQVPIGRLAELTHHSIPAVSQKISALERQSLLERVPHPSDRRVCYVRLTPSGRETGTEGFRQFTARMDVALEALGAERIETLITLMRELTDALERQLSHEQTLRQTAEKLEEETP